MKKKDETTTNDEQAIAVIEAEVPALLIPIKQTRLALSINFGKVGTGMNLEPRDFPTVKIPTGGATQFQIKTLTGDVSTPHVDAVITGVQTARTYWKDSFGSGETQPPDCVSAGGVFGIGDPGGECAKCVWNRYGTKRAPNGKETRGKACREGLQVLFYRGSNVLPELLQLPPTSLKAFREYMLALAGQQLPYYSVMTRISLTQTKNTGGIPYSEARFTFLRMLGENEMRGAAERFNFCVNEVLLRLAPDTVEDPFDDPYSGGR